ncbi:MAG: hypothetical protein LIO86_05780 [Lachnospiraceae bacterium]|nr:hypothetical protein [Lachnospiraceae bacterium]
MGKFYRHTLEFEFFKVSQDDALGEEDVNRLFLLRAELSTMQVLAVEQLGFSKRKVQRMLKSLAERD